MSVIDSNRPGDVILTFDIHSANVLCIATVAGNQISTSTVSIETIKLIFSNETGVKDNDFGQPASELNESHANGTNGDNGNKSDDDERSNERAEPVVGSIRYVSCSVAGSEPVDTSQDKESEGLNTFSLISSLMPRIVRWLFFLI